MTKINLIFLAFILIVGFFLRFWNLSSVPPSPSLDEVSIGWNAYSILKTGEDEYGTKFPFLLRAYDDWRPALYVYSVIPFVWAMGLEVISIRLPSVIFSLLAITSTFFLVRVIFEEYKQKEFIALITSLLLAISPWHIYISRLGHEVNLGYFLAILGIFLFLLFIKGGNKVLLPFSVLSFSFSFYGYQSTKIFVPLIFIFLAILFHKDIIRNLKLAFFSSLLIIILASPILLNLTSSETMSRFRGSSAFDASQQFYYDNFVNFRKYKEQGDIVGQITHHKRVLDLKIFFSQYISHLNPYWLFSGEEKESFKAPNIGLLYLWELPLLLMGISFLFKKEINKKIKYLLLFWILIALIPPSISRGVPHAMRSFNVLPVPQILTALGIVFAYGLFKTNFARKIILFFLSISVIISVLYFSRQYFLAFPRTHSDSFQYALRDAISYTYKNNGKYKNVVFSNENNLHQSYMFYLFYSKYDPLLYQSQGGTISGGYAEEHSFGKFKFEPLEKRLGYPRGTLLVGNFDDFPKNKEFYENKESAVFKNLDGKEVVRVLPIK